MSDLTKAEEWRPVADPNYSEHYEVSSHGRVRRTTGGRGRAKAGHVLWQRTVKSGHKRVLLCNAPAQDYYFVHTLVLEAFVGLQPQGTECCHNDNIPAHNWPSNLRWGTPSSNRMDRPDRGVKIRGEQNCNAKLDADAARSIRVDRRAAKDIAAQFGVSTSTIWRIKSGEVWAHA